ncbi:Predicted amidohydrolase [Izhakiella capsodis]|uniref:Omega-amidase YafV n=1 Tax=Izhakiella capsodis TaxID=1367852 RepID=A0A1I4YLF2_9GAMM|nr:amidohydrolase [Izhakiella capsodis]SFN38836.1 Predicted amidohydrolase [Izhakiella capsodis]
MSTLNAILLQQPLAWMDGEANLRHFDSVMDGIDACDLIVLPEMFTTGFAREAAQHSLPEAQVIEWLQGHARRSDALIAGSAAIRTEKGAVNRFLLVEPGGKVHRYDKRHLFRMGEEHKHYLAGVRREIIEWRGWRILPQICYDLRFPVFARNRNDYDLALYVASWPTVRAHHWQTLLLARAIENQAYVMGCNRVGSDGNQINYSGDSLIICPQGEILASAQPHQPARLDATLSLEMLNDYRARFPAWRDADSFTL